MKRGTKKVGMRLTGKTVISRVVTVPALKMPRVPLE